MCMCCPMDCLVCFFEEICCTLVDLTGLPFALCSLLPEHLAPFFDSMTGCMTSMSSMTRGMGGFGGYY
jgi:hypothetical protein